MKIFFGRYPKDHTKERAVRVRIDYHDTWGMYQDLAQIITPCLKKLKEVKHGAPYVDDIDVPEELRDGELPDYETGENHFLKWDWVLDEMIWAFEQDTIDWEDQFHSGVFDMDFKEVDRTGTGENAVIHTETIYGPNHTHKVDWDGMKTHSERMKRGRMLFAKYYNGLWD